MSGASFSEFTTIVHLQCNIDIPPTRATRMLSSDNTQEDKFEEQLSTRRNMVQSDRESVLLVSALNYFHGIFIRAVDD
jgi:hypothetical protein